MSVKNNLVEHDTCVVVPFSKANLTSNYFFQQIFGESAILQSVLEELLGIQIAEIVKVERDYKIKGGEATHSISCDVFAIDMNERIYDLEMQNYKEKYQFHRIRFYVGQIDNKYFVKKQRDENKKKKGYADMPEVYCIWLCNYSANEFTEGYSEYKLYDLKSEISGNNGVHQIFFDIRKYNGDNPRLKELFRYMQEPTDLVAEECQWEVIKQIHKKYKKMKENEEKRDDYMKFNRAHEIGYELGIEQGIEQGIERGIAQGKEQGEALGIVKGELKAINGIMANLHVDAEKALHIIGIPEVEWGEYIKKLNCKDERIIA